MIQEQATPGVRIFALVTDAFGGRGGIAQFNRDFFCALVQHRLAPAIAVLPRNAPDGAALSTGIVQEPARSSRIAYISAALHQALSRRIDVVFCGHLHLAPLALVIARLAGAKLMVQMHGIEAWERPNPLQKRAVEVADLVLCVSRYTRNRVLGWATIPPERVLVLPNTVREIFTPGDGSVLRAEWGLQGKQILLTVGRMDSRERYKGHDCVIRAIPRLVAAGHDVIYIVVGEGDDLTRLKNLAEEMGVSSRVRFTGALEAKALVEVYRLADLFVMPSTKEGFGIVFLEAMASGTPAFGLSVAGAQDALVDAEQDMGPDPNDLSIPLARALERGKPNPAELAAMVWRRFGRETFADRAHTALNRVLESA